MLDLMSNIFDIARRGNEKFNITPPAQHSPCVWRCLSAEVTHYKV